MSLKYEHTQKPGLPFYLALTMLVVVGFILCTTDVLSGWIFALVVCLMLYLLLLMSSLTVAIDNTYIRVRFGPGVFFKKFPLSEIAGTGPKFKTYVWGWGIRWYPVGWLYNIAGFDSVEIIFKNGKKTRIGTDEPERLAEAIRQSIS